MELLSNLDVVITDVIIIVGSFLGSIKTVSTVKTEEHICSRWLDTLLGAFCGIMLGYYFKTDMNIYISGLIALLGGISGSLIIAVIIELIPRATKEVINSYIKKVKFK